MIHIAVLGAGGHSQQHGKALAIVKQRQPHDIRLAAVCDLDKNKAHDYARRFGFASCHQDLDTMIERERIDGIVAVTPIEATERLASSILEKGIPVMIEKPPARDLDGAQRLHALAMNKGSCHMISLNRRFNPALAKAMEWISEDMHNRQPTVVVARMLRHMRKEPDFLAHTGIHCIDTVLSILGKPVSISSSRHRTGTCHSYDSQLKFKTGASAHLIISPDSGHREETYEIQGEQYDALVNERACSLSIFYKSEEVVSWTLPELAESVTRTGVLRETEVFIECLEKNKCLGPTLTDTLLAMRTAEAIKNNYTQAPISFDSSIPQEK